MGVIFPSSTGPSGTTGPTPSSDIPIDIQGVSLTNNQKQAVRLILDQYRNRIGKEPEEVTKGSLSNNGDYATLLLSVGVDSRDIDSVLQFIKDNVQPQTGGETTQEASSLFTIIATEIDVMKQRMNVAIEQFQAQQQAQGGGTTPDLHDLYAQHGGLESDITHFTTFVHDALAVPNMGAADQNLITLVDVIKSHGITDINTINYLVGLVKDQSGYNAATTTPVTPVTPPPTPPPSGGGTTIDDLSAKYPNYDLKGYVNLFILNVTPALKNSDANALIYNLKTISQQLKNDGKLSDTDIASVLHYVLNEAKSQVVVTSPPAPPTGIFDTYRGENLEGRVAGFTDMVTNDLKNGDGKALSDRLSTYMIPELQKAGLSEGEINAVLNYILGMALGATSQVPVIPPDQPPVTPPDQPPVTPPDQPPVAPPDQSGMPAGLNANQQSIVNNMLDGMKSDYTNYTKNYDQSVANLATPAQIRDLQNDAQGQIDRSFALPTPTPSNVAAPTMGQRIQSLIDAGISKPLLDDVIAWLKKQAGFDPPVNDLSTNFPNDAKELVTTGTKGEKDFINDLSNLIKPNMSDKEIVDAFNNYFKTHDVFREYGIDPKDFQKIASWLPGVHGIQFPVPNDIQNAWVQSFTLQSPYLREQVQGFLSEPPKNFTAFQEEVQNIMPSATGTVDEQPLRELSHNQIKSPYTQPIANNEGNVPDGSALFSFQNNSKVSDSQVYITITGTYQGQQCCVAYDRDGTPVYMVPGRDAQGNSITIEYDSKGGKHIINEPFNPQDYSYPLSYFDRDAGGKNASLYIPPLEGGRVYTSVGEPLQLTVDTGGGIVAPNPHDGEQPNNRVHWDKMEFTTQVDHIDPQTGKVAQAGMIFFNATAVDNVTLPLEVSITRTDGSIHAGGLKKGVFDILKNKLLAMGPPWSGLLVKDKDGNYTGAILSVMDGASTSPGPGLPHNFDQDYFTKVQPGQTESWMEAAYNKYSKVHLTMSTADSKTPGDDGSGIWVADLLTGPFKLPLKFTLHRQPPAGPPNLNVMELTIPENASELLSGTGPGWNAGSMQDLTDECCKRGYFPGSQLDQEPNSPTYGHYQPVQSDNAINAIVKTLPPNDPLSIHYSETKLNINGARDFSVQLNLNTWGATNQQVIINRLCQSAQDGIIDKTILTQFHEVKGIWIPNNPPGPSLQELQKTYIDPLPKGDGNKVSLQASMDLALQHPNDEAPLCQTTYTAMFQAAYDDNSDLGVQFEDIVARTIAENAVKKPGHEGDRYGDIYTSSYTDSTGHEGAANAVPHEYGSGFMALGDVGDQTYWTS